MGVKGDNLELISGLLLSSFILNYMLIRVKGKGLEYEKQKEKRRGRTNEREREKQRRKRSIGKSRFLDFNSSVEVGNGLCYS